MISLHIAALAHAHVGDLISGIDVWAHADGGWVVEASYGLVVPDDDGYAWVCHEAVTELGAVRAPRYVQNRDGTWLASLSDLEQGRGGNTLFRSTDGGCSWDLVTGLDGQLVAAALFDNADPARAWAVTAQPDGASAIFTSVDSGATWAVEVDAPGRLFYALRRSANENTTWASATDLGGTRGYVSVRPSSGTWTEHEVPLPAGTEGAKLTVVDARDGLRAWVIVDPIGDDTLLQTDDAGQTWSSVYTASGEINDAALGDDGLWLVLNSLELVQLVGTEVGPPVDDFPLANGIEIVGKDLVAAPQSYLVNALVSVAPGESGFQTTAYPDDIVGPLDCPPGTETADVCGPLWDVLLPDLRGFDTPPTETAEDTGAPPDPPDDTGGSGDDKGCGCASTGAVHWAERAVRGVARRR